MRTRVLAFVGVAAACLCAGTPALADGPKCLEIGQIFNWKVLNDRTMIVEDNWHQKFKVSLMVDCINLNFKERVGFKAFGEFSSLSCLSKGDDVLVHDIGMGERCPISNIEPYTAAMEAADKAAAAAAKAQQDTH